MTIPVWGLLGVFTSTFVAPFVSAVAPIPLALPQTVRYDEYIANQIARAEFSSDPQHLLSIYKTAGQAEGRKGEQGPFITAFIYSGSTCSTIGDEQSYRIVLHNIGNETAQSISVQNLYPEYTSLLRAEPEAEHDSTQRLLTWGGQELASGGTLTFYFSVKTEQAAAGYLDNLTVYYGGGDNGMKVTIGERALSGVCTVTDSIRSFIAGRAAPKPAILCDPAEQGCSSNYQGVGLGPNYRRALQPGNQPTICSLHDKQLRQGQVIPCRDNLPQLGPMFAEAMADILPGECRTLEDNRVVQPGMNDALNRRSKPAAYYMGPLNGVAVYESGNDFKRVVHENSLLGIKNLDGVRDVLMPVHISNWGEFVKIARNVYSGSMDPDAAVADMQGRKATWESNVQSQHSSLNTAYAVVQNARKNNFKSILCGGSNLSDVNTCKLLSNAQSTIRAACCGLEILLQTRADLAKGIIPAIPYDCPKARAFGTGGLETGLPQVYAAYEESLNSSSFPAAQNKSLNDYSLMLDSWESRFVPAIDKYKSGDKEAMVQFINKMQEDQVTVFANSLMKAYREQMLVDINNDNKIRLGIYEDKLNKPKEIATSCAKELPNEYDTPDIRSVELTMCENGTPSQPVVAEVNLREETNEIYSRQPIAPPLITQVQVTIDQRMTFGSSCSGRPGDPWWAADCSCDCGQVVPVSEGSLQFCMAGQGSYTVGGLPPPPGWPRPDYLPPGIPEPYVYNNVPNSLAGWWQAIKYSSRQGLVEFSINRVETKSLSLKKATVLSWIGEKFVQPVMAQVGITSPLSSPPMPPDPPPLDPLETLPAGTCGDGTIDANESCDAAAVPNGCPADSICSLCICTMGAPSVTPVFIPTQGVSPAMSPVSPVPSVSPAASASIQPTITPSPSPLIPPTVPIDPTPPITPTIPPTVTPMVTLEPPSLAPSTEASPASPAPTLSPAVTPTIAISPSPSPLITPTVPIDPTPPIPPTVLPTVSPMASRSPSPLISQSPSPSPSSLMSPSPSLPPCPSASPQPSVNPSPNISPSPSSLPLPSTSIQSPSPEIVNPIVWHDIWVTSKAECLANFQGCHHFNPSGSCVEEPSPPPPPPPSPEISPSSPPPSPSTKQSPQPSPVVSPKLCVNPDGTVVYY